jgi:hypothetical protein
MRSFALFVILFCNVTAANCQTSDGFFRSIYSKEVSFIRTDSTWGSQSTIIEYPDFLVVIELPLTNKKGDQDVQKAERFLSFINQEYKSKEIKYVLSSHWHPHSLSGIAPFFDLGISLITAKSNWEYSRENGLLGDLNFQQNKKKVITITQDTTILTNTKYPIQVWFLGEEYTHKPTKDYLFFYMTKSKSLHASCMCAMNNIDFQEKPDFVYNDRITDLDKAIEQRGCAVEHLFKLYSEFDKATNTYKLPTFDQSYFSEFKKRGKPMAIAVNDFSNCDLNQLKQNQDSIIHYLTLKKISAQIINSTVYSCIRKKAYENAVAWARILNLLQVGNSSYIDTLGEAYFRAGDIPLAQEISRQLAILDPKFSDQINVWKNNLLKAQ